MEKIIFVILAIIFEEFFKAGCNETTCIYSPYLRIVLSFVFKEDDERLYNVGLDNLVKTTIDCLKINNIFVGDDKKIVSISASKVFGKHEKISIHLSGTYEPNITLQKGYSYREL